MSVELPLSNIVILVLSTQASTYDEFKEVQTETWVSDFVKKGISCYFYEGGSSHTHLDGNTIKIACDDSLTSTAIKLRKAIEFITNYKKDISLIYRTNLSSYIDSDKFLTYLNKQPDISTLYAGRIAHARLLSEFFFGTPIIRKFYKHLRFGPKVNFCSGAGVFIGKKYFSQLIYTKKYDRYVDDVMLRLVIGEEPDRNQNIFRFDFMAKKDPRVTHEQYQSLLEQGLFHYRFKTQQRFYDAFLMSCMHKQINRKALCVKN